MSRFEETRRALSRAEYEGNKLIIEQSILRVFEAERRTVLRRGFIFSDRNLTKFDPNVIILALDNLVNEGKLSEIKSPRKFTELSYKKNG